MRVCEMRTLTNVDPTGTGMSHVAAAEGIQSMMHANVAVGDIAEVLTTEALKRCPTIPGRMLRDPAMGNSWSWDDPRESAAASSVDAAISGRKVPGALRRTKPLRMSELLMALDEDANGEARRSAEKPEHRFGEAVVILSTAAATCTHPVYPAEEVDVEREGGMRE